VGMNLELEVIALLRVHVETREVVVAKIDGHDAVEIDCAARGVLADIELAIRDELAGAGRRLRRERPRRLEVTLVVAAELDLEDAADVRIVVADLYGRPRLLNLHHAVIAKRVLLHARRRGAIRGFVRVCLAPGNTGGSDEGHDSERD